ncbi:MAG: sensor histidine kinase [Actinomycetota bacterium]
MTSSLVGGNPSGEEPYGQILEAISEGVLVLNEQLKPQLINRAAQRLLGLPPGATPLRLPSDELLTLARSASMGEPREQVLRLWFPVPRQVRVRAEALAGGGVLMLMQDVTEELRAQQVRREFVTHASHELKSPVAGIQTLADAIRQALPDDVDAADRFSERLVKEADRLGRLINDLLDLSRLEEAHSVADEPVDLAEIAHGVVDELDALARSKETRVVGAIETEAWVRGDGQHLRLLLRNLLDNAIRYTPHGGDVRIAVERDGPAVVVRVTDNGIGIPLEARPRIFERFYRVDKGRSRDRGGTGLGLAIVKHVAELHGGTVEVSSEIGRGSVFTIRLPALDRGVRTRRAVGG